MAENDIKRKFEEANNKRIQEFVKKPDDDLSGARAQKKEEDFKRITEQMKANSNDSVRKSRQKPAQELKEAQEKEKTRKIQSGIRKKPDSSTMDGGLMYDPNERVSKRLGSFYAASRSDSNETDEDNPQTNNDSDTAQQQEPNEDNNSTENESSSDENEENNEEEQQNNNENQQNPQDVAKDVAKQALKTAAAQKAKQVAAQAGKKLIAVIAKNPYVLLVIAIILIILFLILIIFGVSIANSNNSKYDEVCNYNLTKVELNKCDTEESTTQDIDKYVVNTAYKISANRNMSDESIKALMVVLKTNALAMGNYNNASKKVSINDCDIKSLYTTENDYVFKNKSSSDVVIGNDSGFWWPIGSNEQTGNNIYGGTPASAVFGNRGFSLTPVTHPVYGTKKKHLGHDLRASRNQNVISVKSGKVEIAKNNCTRDSDGCNGGAGNYVKINHGNGIATRYLHLQPGTVAVSVGDTVAQGQLVGKVGSTGSSTGPHLHFEVIVNGSPVDPKLYISTTDTRPGSSSNSTKTEESAETDNNTTANDTNEDTGVNLESIYSAVEPNVYLRSSYTGTITSLSESDALNFNEGVLNEIMSGSGGYTEILGSIYNNGETETNENEETQEQTQEQSTDNSANKGKVLLIAGHSYNSKCNGISNYCLHTNDGPKTSTGKSQLDECRGPAKASGYAEETETRAFVKSIKSSLESIGVGVDIANQILSDDGSDCASFRNERVNNTSRFNKINWNQYSYVLEVHFNATGTSNPTATGTTTCYSPGYKSLNIDSQIISAVTKNTGYNSYTCPAQSRGLDNYKFFIDKGIPMTYMETEYYDNKSAMKNFINKRSQISKDIADVIKNNYGNALASGSSSASGAYKIYSLDDYCKASEDGGTSSSNSYCGGISLTSTTLSKSEFANALKNAWGNGSSSKRTFADKAEDIYDISIKNNFNPELIPIRAEIEGFSPGRGGNYYGIGCTNKGGGKDCKSYGSFDDGVLGYINTVKKYGVSNLFDVYYVKHYAYIGDKWIKGGSGSGGCYYFPYIKQYYTDSNRASEVEKACQSGSAIKTNDADQYAYSGYQIEKSAKIRQSLFGISTSSNYECSNMSGNGVVQDGTFGAQVADYAVRTFDSFGYSQGNRFGSNQVDCSSMVYRAYKQFNVDISMNGDSTSEGELVACIKKEKIIQESELKPGDLIFYSNNRGKRLGRTYGIGHVEMYIGNNQKFGAHSAGRAWPLQVSVTNFKSGEGSYYCRPY